MMLPIFILNIENDDDREFMASVYRDNYKLMQLIAMKFMGNTMDADDVVSDTCMSLIKKIDVLRRLEPEARSAYINVATTNTALGVFRKRKRMNELLDDGELFRYIQDEGDTPEALVLRSCKLQELKDAFNKISEIDQAALNMKYMLEYSDAEIAKVLGVKENSVRMRMKRARHRLYEKIDKNNI